MPFTHYPNGLSSMGCPLPNSPNFPMNGRTHYWINGVGSGAGVLGNNSNPGTDPSVPLLTMARAFQLIGSGDVIHFTGNIREQITAPVGIFDVTIIGECTRPRHADAHTGNNGYSTSTWRPAATPVAATPLLKTLQQGWRFINILFACPTDAAGVQLFRNGGAGDAERDSGHASFYSCRFDGGQDGIEDLGGNAFVIVDDCLFRGQTGKAMKDNSGAIGTLLCWDIRGNRFNNNANHIVMGLNECTVRHNAFGTFTTQSLNLNGGTGSNVVFGNAFNGTYSVAGGYNSAAATDTWAGNYNILTDGVTAALPA